MISGIYAILNLVNGKYYIGSAKDFQDRWRLHLLDLNRDNHHNRHLQRAWNKHGQDKFKFVIVEECEDELLESREQFFIDHLDSTNIEKGYNICAAGRNRSGVKISEETREKLRLSHLGHKHSAETKAKMSVIHKGNQVNKGRKWSKETIEKRAKSNTGQKRSDEAKKKMSDVQKGRIVSEETRLKMRNAKLGKKPSEETRKKLSEAAKKDWEERNKPLDYTCDMWV